MGPTISHLTWSRHVPQLFPSHSPLVSSLLPDLQSSLPQTSTPPLPPKVPTHCRTIHSHDSILHLQSDHCTCGNQHPARAATRATPPCALSLPSTQLPVALLLPLRCPYSWNRVFTLQSTNDLWTTSSTIFASAPKKTISNPLWLCSTDNKSTYSQQAYRHRATSPRARRQTGQRWKESAPGMVRRCPAG